MTQTHSARANQRQRPAWTTAAVVAVVVAVGFASLAMAQRPGRELTDLEEANLANFDDLDFHVFTGQKWDELSRSHAQGIIVHWPDGRTTEGIDVHIEDLKAMFVFAPDTRVEVHPIRIASGKWTAVTGVLEGTFTEPMPIGDGEPIPPTGKAFKLSVVTIARWDGENGTISEEWLFWDNLLLMKQMGLAD